MGLNSSLRRDTRFCILGAGAAGLSAAWYLHERGYERITILESSERVGGKCFSITRNDVTLDLGAALLMPDYKRVMAMASELGIATRGMPRFTFIRNHRDPPAFLSISDLIFEKHGLLEYAAAALRFLGAHRKHADVLRKPGFGGMSGSSGTGLDMQFGEWARSRGMAPLLAQLELFFAGFGYGDINHLPAGCVLRYISVDLFLGMVLSPVTNFGTGWPRRFNNGFGDFWQRAAARFDVRLNATVKSVTRGRTVSVTWEERDAAARSESFDVLVVACPPAATSAFLAWSEEEARLFGQVRTLPYAVTVCDTTNIPETVSLVERPEGPGHLIQLWKPAPGPGICAFYTTPAPGAPVDQIMTLVREDIGRIYPEATVGPSLIHAEWQYFPHVDVAAFAGGFFDRFEAMQGRHSTWYAGGLLAFESVENIAAYSECLVKRMTTSVCRN